MPALRGFIVVLRPGLRQTPPNHSEHDALNGVPQDPGPEAPPEQPSPAVRRQHQPDGVAVADGALGTERLLDGLDDADGVDDGVAHDAGEEADGGAAGEAPPEEPGEPAAGLEDVVRPVLRAKNSTCMRANAPGSVQAIDAHITCPSSHTHGKCPRTEDRYVAKVP